jgi:hypothetical protein
MTVKLKARYSLTLKTYEKLIDEGQDIHREQEVEFEVDAAQAILAGAAWIDFRGAIHPSKDKEQELLSQKARCNIAGILWSMHESDPPRSKSLWRLTGDIAQILTPEEAKSRYLTTLAAQEQARSRTEPKKIRTLLDEWIPRILTGEGAISETQYSFEIRLDSVMVLPKDVFESLLTALEKEKLRGAIFLENEGERHVRTKWIAAHGSEALRKKLEDIFDRAALNACHKERIARDAYHEERIAREIGERWFLLDESEFDAIVSLANPNKLESNLLSEALAKWPDWMFDMRLVRAHRDETWQEWGGDENTDDWPSALIMRLPWEPCEKAMHFIIKEK